jgi:hypothetical protein
MNDHGNVTTTGLDYGFDISTYHTCYRHKHTQRRATKSHLYYRWDLRIEER